jgi:hypothetical protein
LLLLGADCVLLLVAWLRETPEFWRNSGGASIALREMVRVLFFPSLLGLATAQVMLWAVLLRSRCQQTVALYLLAVLAALGLALVLLVTVANNLLNLWEGRPFHWHPEAP